jgi:hypothetical protein
MQGHLFLLLSPIYAPLDTLPAHNGKQTIQGSCLALVRGGN